MTHHTDTERAEFEALGISKGWNMTAIMLTSMPPKFSSYVDPATQRAFESWQAARRAPSAPVLDGLREAAQRAHDWMDSQADSQSKGNHHSFDLFCLRQERDALAEALAAAPQTPKAESMISSREVVSNPGSGVKVTRLNLSEAGRAALQSKASHIPEVSYSVSNATLAAPVQLPEYGIDTANHAGIRVRGYTKDQVLEILAQHGIKTK